MTKFSFNTIDDFDNHIEISVPNYSHIYDLLKSLSSYFIRENTNVYDLGCSTGLLLRNLSIENKLDNVEFIGYEIADNLKPKKPVYGYHWVKRDLTKGVQLINTNLVFSIFTLQFLTIDERINLVNSVYESLNIGGAFIVCEKIFLSNGFMQDLFTFSYFDYKQRSFSSEVILQKQNDLRSIMRPLSNKANIDIFKRAGFRVDTFFQSLQFMGYILLK